MTCIQKYTRTIIVKALLIDEVNNFSLIYLL